MCVVHVYILLIALYRYQGQRQLRTEKRQKKRREEKRKKTHERGKKRQCEKRTSRCPPSPKTTDADSSTFSAVPGNSIRSASLNGPDAEEFDEEGVSFDTFELVGGGDD